MRNKVHSFDRWAAAIINRLPGFLRPIFQICTIIGHPVTMILPLSALAYLAKHRGHPRLSLFALICIASLVLPSIFKALTRRRRPDTLYVQKMYIKSSSFPSGHAYGSAVTFGLLTIADITLVSSQLMLPLVFVFTFGALCIGIARVYLGAHYPSDVVAGWLMALGVLSAGLIVIW